MITAAEAEQFFRAWIARIDADAPLEAFFPFLVDGPFEEWSYPGGVQLADRAALVAFFRAAGPRTTYRIDAIEALEAAPQADGTVVVSGQVRGRALTAAGVTTAGRTRYTMTLARGSSSHDPAGAHPKVRRYRVERL